MALKKEQLEYNREARDEALKIAKEKMKLYIDDITNKDIIVILNYSEPSYRKRLHVYSMKHRKFLRDHHVAHGSGSANSTKGKAYANTFSNLPESHKTSIGCMVTGDTYTGKHGLSLKLKGLEQGKNNNVEKRHIVIHAADYVTDKFIIRNERAGCSWGCPAVDPVISQELIELIKGGVFVYAHS